MRLLRSADALRDAAAGVWPGLIVPKRLMVSSTSAGQVHIIGDTALIAGFEWTDRSAKLGMRVGTVPDSLTRLRVSLPWNGERYETTLVPDGFPDSLMLHFLLHESFHTYQFRQRRQRHGAFLGSGSVEFPVHSVEAIAAQLMEGELIASALETQGGVRDDLIRRALAAERLRVSPAGLERLLRRPRLRTAGGYGRLRRVHTAHAGWTFVRHRYPRCGSGPAPRSYRIAA